MGSEGSTGSEGGSSEAPMRASERLHEREPNPLQVEIQRLAAILRDYGMHDPECPARQTEKAQRYTGACLVRPDCECWLAVSSDG